MKVIISLISLCITALICFTVLMVYGPTRAVILDFIGYETSVIIDGANGDGIENLTKGGGV